MKRLLLLFVIFASITVAAQTSFYVAAKSGLSMRDKPDAKATVIGKIPYGTKVSVNYPGEIVNITTEGVTGAWATVTYSGKTGYIVNSYLFPSPPPKAGVETMKQYLAQLSAPFGTKLVVKNGSMNNIEEGGWEIRKQLYKNGSEWHEFVGYEYHSNTYFLPLYTMEQAFFLLRLIPEFKEVFDDKAELPTKTKTVKKGEVEYEIKVETEMLGENPWIKKISVGFADGAIYDFQMYQLDNQLVIFYSSGV
jgi:uncharacterized protein YgiM (DUF1202 family)